jgi:hypothetical protein
MMTVFLRDFLQATTPPFPEPRYIYVVSDGADVLYVGQTSAPDVRIRQHLETHTPLGQLALAHLPVAGQWLVSLFSLAECAPWVRAHLPIIEGWYAGALAGTSETLLLATGALTDTAEEAAILHWRPCLNVSLNRYKASVPVRYGTQTFANAGVKFPRRPRTRKAG